MAVLNQNIIVFEDDTVNLEFEVSTPNESNAYYGLSNNTPLFPSDGFCWLVSTAPNSVPIGPNNSVILEKSSGWFTGVGYSGASHTLVSIIQNTTDASPTSTTYYEYSGWTTSGNGEGLLIDVAVGASGGVANITVSQLSPSYLQSNGQNFKIGDTITIPTSLIGGTTDVIVELTADDVYPPFFPSNTGGLTIDSANFATIYPYSNQTYNPATITVYLTQDDYQASSGPLVTGKTYYWQLVWGRNLIGLSYDPTQVVAEGTLQIEPSQFSTEGHRP